MIFTSSISTLLTLFQQDDIKTTSRRKPQTTDSGITFYRRDQTLHITVGAKDSYAKVVGDNGTIQLHTTTAIRGSNDRFERNKKRAVRFNEPQVWDLEEYGFTAVQSIAVDFDAKAEEAGELFAEPTQNRFELQNLDLNNLEIESDGVSTHTKIGDSNIKQFEIKGNESSDFLYVRGGTIGSFSGSMRAGNDFSFFSNTVFTTRFYLHMGFENAEETRGISPNEYDVVDLHRTQLPDESESTILGTNRITIGNS